MKYRLQIFFLLLSLLILFAIALPEFKTNVFGQEFRYPSIGFSKIGVPKDYGSFKKGGDIFPATRITVKVEESDSFATTETFDIVFDAIQERLDLTGMYDISIRKVEKVVTTEFNEDGEQVSETKAMFIEFTIPDHYERPDQLVQWLTSKGEITFSNGFGTENLSFDDEDIVSSIEIDYSLPLSAQGDYNYTENLVFEFSDAIQSDVISALNATSEDGQNMGVFMNIDGSPAFLIRVHEDLTYTKVRAIPMTGETSEQRKTYLAIVQSYFGQDEALKTTISTDETTRIEPLYNPYGGKVIAIGFIVAIALVAAFILLKYGLKVSLLFKLLLALELLFIIDILKLLNAPLSIGTVIGFLASIILLSIVNIRVLESSKDVSSDKRLLRLLSIAILILTIVIHKLSLNLSYLTDVVGVFLVTGLVLGIITLIYLPILQNIYNNFKFDYRFEVVNRLSSKLDQITNNLKTSGRKFILPILAFLVIIASIVMVVNNGFKEADFERNNEKFNLGTIIAITAVTLITLFLLQYYFVLRNNISLKLKENAFILYLSGISVICTFLIYYGFLSFISLFNSISNLSLYLPVVLNIVFALLVFTYTLNLHQVEIKNIKTIKENIKANILDINTNLVLISLITLLPLLVVLSTRFLTPAIAFVLAVVIFNLTLGGLVENEIKIKFQKPDLSRLRSGSNDSKSIGENDGARTKDTKVKKVKVKKEREIRTEKDRLRVELDRKKQSVRNRLNKSKAKSRKKNRR